LGLGFGVLGENTPERVFSAKNTPDRVFFKKILPTEYFSQQNRKKTACFSRKTQKYSRNTHEILRNTQMTQVQISVGSVFDWVTRAKSEILPKEYFSEKY
jgi:hypothetical protein